MCERVGSLYISGRERSIISLLLKASSELTAGEIAQKLNVSNRTVHRDMNNIEHLLEDYDLQLEKKSGVGLKIVGTASSKSKLEAAIDQVVASGFVPKERQTIILSSLLETNEPIKLFTLANELSVTTATVSQDLDTIEQVLKAFRLDLIRRRGYGVKLEGAEEDKRAALSYLISNHLDPFEFVSLLKENIKKRAKQNAISDRLLGLVNPNKLRAIEETVEAANDELPYKLADSAHIGLVVHLSLAMERLEKGEGIQFDREYLKQVSGTKEYDVAKNMVRRLERVLSATIPEDEIGYITMHLRGAKLRASHQDNHLIDGEDTEIVYRARELIRGVGKRLNRKLSAEGSLLTDLTTHLKPALYRLDQRMQIKNPLLGEIMGDYSELFHVVKESAEEAFPGMAFPDDEIAYLVLHFAAALLRTNEEMDLKALAICASGIGSAKIMATRLQQRIPEIKEVKNLSLFDLKDISPAEYDLVISTVPLSNFDREYIIASPMLLQDDVERIKKAVRNKRLTYNNLRGDRKKDEYGTDLKQEDFLSKLADLRAYSGIILDILHTFHVTDAGGRAFNEALMMACKGLQISGNIKDYRKVHRNLTDRAQLGGLGIPGTKLALYHARSEGVLRPVFTLCTLQDLHPLKGMDGEEMSIKTIILMLAPAEADEKTLEVLSHISSLIVQDERSSRLFESESEQEIKTFLSGQLYRFLQNKKIL